VAEVLEGVSLSRMDVDFTCSGSSDFLAGHAFSFVVALDALGAWPPIKESHVEGEAAWALYEAWVKMLCHEEIEVALVYGFALSGNPAVAGYDFPGRSTSAGPP